MDSQRLLRHLLRIPASYRTTLFPPPRIVPHIPAQHLSQTRYLTLPPVIRPSFWASMIPKPLKSRSPTSPAKETNPYTPYIILSLLVGSQAIQILWLKQERGHTLRRKEAQIGLLREVIDRVQRGEKVDIEGVLGVGDAQREAEWKELVEGVKEEEILFQSRKKRRALREAGEQAVQVQEEVKEEVKEGEEAKANTKMKVESFGGGKFY